jgi:hypothetical protein
MFGLAAIGGRIAGFDGDKKRWRTLRPATFVEAPSGWRQNCTVTLANTYLPSASYTAG